MKVKRNEITCTKCGLIKSASINNYFKTENPLYNEFFPTCKDCVYELYNIHVQSGKGLRNAVIKICELLDRPFIEEVFHNTEQKEKDHKKFLGIFLKNSMMQQYRKQGILQFKDSIYASNTIQAQQAAYDDETKIYSEEWNGYYTQTDINYLNKYYTGLHDDFKIVTTNHKDYARKIAQASLAVNKAFQEMSNGVAGADKKYKDLQSTFDTLSKSAQFSENSRSNAGAGINGISQIVDKIETKMWIYTTEEFEKDSIEHLLNQFNNIQKSI